ncbi:hypothetical protein [Pseudochrobactrum sp. XF203]|uniref:hypothetical protein n=1 Tax=Pseudochrobactrum sp. XF203 TaxID=2879116 RepID=UPI001CE2F5EF|nr:hypothetical protein [Pseudochrobactrum sp. XF203]UCA47737.1 hypothetical protein LDL70_16955 [Pseudochrobactrum sp. XF203]
MNKGKSRLAASVLFILLGVRHVYAISATQESYLDKMAGTLSVISQPFISEGTVTGCTFVFNVLTRDHIYRQGKFIKVTGSIGLMKAQNSLGVTVKVVVNEMAVDQSGQVVLKPSAPDRAYLIGSGYKNNLSGLVNSGQSDTAGGVFSVYQLEPSLPILMEQLQTQAASIGFNRAGGQSDIQINIDLTVENFTNAGERLHNQKAIQEFSECMIVLLEADK